MPSDTTCSHHGRHTSYITLHAVNVVSDSRNGDNNNQLCILKLRNNTRIQDETRSSPFQKATTRGEEHMSL
jgi:hypothetical protein